MRRSGWKMRRRDGNNFLCETRESWETVEKKEVTRRQPPGFADIVE
jgi:hypothetical protein